MSTTTITTPREDLRRHFATRRTAVDVPAWLDRAWTRAVLMAPHRDDDSVLDLLRSEWDTYRAEHPDEPLVAFRPPPLFERDEEVDPEPIRYDMLPPLRHGRYGLDLPTHEDRVREEQERLARRDSSFYGF